MGVPKNLGEYLSWYQDPEYEASNTEQKLNGGRPTSGGMICKPDHSILRNWSG